MKPPVQYDRKGIIGAPIIMLVIVIGISSVIVIFYVITGAGQVSVSVGKFESSLNKYIQTPEKILSARCATIERGVFYLSEIREGKNCGLSCIKTRKAIEVSFSVPSLDFKKSCVLSSDKKSETEEKSWTYYTDIPITVIKNGESFNGRVVIGS